MRIFCPALLTTLLCCACSSERAPSHLTPEQLRAELRLRLEAAAEQGFSGAASITRGGAPLLVEGYGLANRERHLPNSVDTAFDFGSVLKDLTAAAIFKLAGEGQLDVTDPLAAIFDDVPSDKAAITILQLIEHRDQRLMIGNEHRYHGKLRRLCMPAMQRQRQWRLLGQGVRSRRDPAGDERLRPAVMARVNASAVIIFQPAQGQRQTAFQQRLQAARVQHAGTTLGEQAGIIERQHRRLLGESERQPRSLPFAT